MLGATRTATVVQNVLTLTADMTVERCTAAARDQGILLVKLGKGQEVKMKCIAVKVRLIPRTGSLSAWGFELTCALYLPAFSPSHCCPRSSVYQRHS